ncbi:MAG: B12-binding domain-containing radical SAM protein [Desulfobacterales bacterium]|nr:B12-binding domain-containing radical SAM protein [Desulfobacterales bacterium]
MTSSRQKKRIALVHPRGFNWFPGKRDITDIANRMVPQGMLSIAAYLIREGHDIFVYDCLGPGAPVDINRQVSAILAFQPQIVGFSTTTSSFPDAADIAQKIKEQNPDIVTVCGGVHVSALREKLLSLYPAFNYFVAGEGEVTMSELAAGVDPVYISGLIRRQNGVAVANEPRKHIDNLDDLPFPAYEKLTGFPHDYHLPLFSYSQTPGATMITSRGCMFQCSYCDRSVFQKGFRYNSAAYIYEHMKYLRDKFGVRHVNIYDDLFTANKKRIMELCEKLARQPLGMNFNCAVRVGYTDDDLLKMLKDAGCLMVSLGIESADPGMLARHKSGVSLDDVRDTVRRIQSARSPRQGFVYDGPAGRDRGID